MKYSKRNGGRPKTGRTPKVSVGITKELHSKIVDYAIKNNTTLIDTIERAFNLFMGVINGKKKD